MDLKTSQTGVRKVHLLYVLLKALSALYLDGQNKPNKLAKARKTRTSPGTLSFKKSLG